MSFDLTAIDLFCGCGGLSLGAARAGFRIRLGVDSDARTLAAHSRNFPHSLHSGWDLSRASGTSVLRLASASHGEVDVVIGGPPCQGFSYIGKRNLLDERNQLIWHFFRLVAEIKPKAFVVENVPGILSPRYAPILEAAKSHVAGEYVVFPAREIKAIDAGAPTVRTRVVMLGFQAKLSPDPKEFWRSGPPHPPTPVVREALDGLPVDIHPGPHRAQRGKRTVRVSREGAFFDSATGRVPHGVGDTKALEEYGKGIVTACTGTRHSRKLEKRYAGLAYGQMDPITKSVKLDPEGYCPTLRAGTGPERGSFQAVRPIHYLRPRVITPREAARLQGFPDWYQFDTTKWHTFRQLGNSVSPLVSEFIMRRVKGALSRA